MTERVDVVVIGAGVGGLATAIRLARTGHRVVVLERRSVAGGKLACLRRDGFTFDVGPSLVTWPDVLDELFRSAGTSTRDQLDLRRLDPQFHYHWTDGSSLTVPDDEQARVAAFEQLSPGAGDSWRRFDERGRRIWDVSARTFLAGPMDRPRQLLRRMGAPNDLWEIAPVRTLHAHAARYFHDSRLVQWAGRYATYSGSSPFRAPATLACIQHLESRYGCWYPMGGLDGLRAALVRVAVMVGADVRSNWEVTAIVSDENRVTGVELADGSTVRARVVVANADAEHVFTELLPDRRALRRVRRAGHSMSGFAITAAIRGTTAELGHHNVWFSPDDRAEFADLDGGRMPEQPTVYACVSSVTDSTQAPSGHENWFLLVNAPPGLEVDRDREQTRVLDWLAAFGIDLRARLVWSDTITPGDLAERYRAPAGAIYGTSSNGRRAAFLRPRNRTRRAGLYLVGGSSHPGGGLPLVTVSARIVAALVHDELAAS